MEETWESHRYEETERVLLERRRSCPRTVHEEEIERDFSLPDASPFWDVVLRTEEGERLYVSKSVLGLWSNVFYDLLQMEFEENVVPLPGKNKEQIVGLLTAIYPPSPREVDLEGLPVLLPLAEEYDMPVLKRKCEERMVQCLKMNTLDVSTALELADGYNCGPSVRCLCEQILCTRPDLEAALLAQKYNLPNLQAACVESLSEEYQYIKDDGRLALLGSSMLQRVMSRAFEKLQAKMACMQSVFREKDDNEGCDMEMGSYLSCRITQEVCRNPSGSPTSSSEESNLLFPYRAIRRTTSSYV